MNTGDELLDIKQAAAFLQVSVTSLRRWTNAGDLASLRIGGRRERRFRRADLLAFLESRPATEHVVDATGASDAARSRDTVVQGVPVPHGTHLCGFYASDIGRVTLASSFLFDGLQDRSVAYLVAASSVRDEIVAFLEQRRPSLRADIDARRLVVSSYASSGEAQLRYFERELGKAADAGAQAMRVVGDVAGLAKRISHGSLAAYEAGYDRRIAHRFPVVTLCQYDVREFSGVDVLKALKGHADTVRYRPDLVLA